MDGVGLDKCAASARAAQLVCPHGRDNLTHRCDGHLLPLGPPPLTRPQNWGTVPFAEVVASWYWGHARLGDYSIVWFDFLDLAGQESASAYAAKDGKLLTASCAANAVVVRPAGANYEYPPSDADGSPDGFSVVMDLGPEGILRANVTVESVLAQGGNFYQRFAGSVVGSIDGGEPITGGVALFEEVKLTT